MAIIYIWFLYNYFSILICIIDIDMLEDWNSLKEEFNAINHIPKFQAIEFVIILKN